MLILIRSFLYLSGLFLVFSCSLNSQNYYVDSFNGKDVNNGLSADSPWRTIQKAAELVKPGDTCFVLPGNYFGRVQIDESGTSGAPIVFKSLGEGTVTAGFSLNNVDYVHVIGFEITNVPSGHWKDEKGINVLGSFCEIRENYIHDNFHEGIRLGTSDDLNSATNCIVKDNLIIRCGQAGMEINGSSNLIENNDISGTVQWKISNPSRKLDADGLRFFGTGHVFRGNYIHDIYLDDPENENAHVDAIQTWGPAYDILFEENVFLIRDTTKRNETQIAMMEEKNSPVRDLVFMNNVFGETYRGFNLHEVEGLRYYNNSFVNMQNYPLELHTCPGAQILNNLFYNTDVLMINRDSRDGLNLDFNAYFGEVRDRSYVVRLYPDYLEPSSNDIVGVNAGLKFITKNEIILEPDSPLINRGKSLISQNVLRDLYGTSRPQGDNYDIGAIEKIIKN